MRNLNKTRVVASVLFLLIGSFSVSVINTLLHPNELPDALGESVSLTNIPEEPLESDVLGEKDDNPIFFTVNVPSRFKKDISAPNIVYSVTGGEGIKVSEGQYPEISNTGVLSLQNETGDLALVAGNGIAIDGLAITNSRGFIGAGGVTLTESTNGIITVSSETPDYTLSGWSKLGNTIVLTTVSDLVTVDAITFGNATVGNGKSIKPDTDLGSDLGSAAFRFNNLYVGNINSNSSTSTAGQATFTYESLNTALTEASVLINPTAPVANGQLLGLSVAGYQRAMIDEDGDLTLGYNDAISAPASDYPLSVYGHNGTQVSFINTAGDAYFAGNVGIGITTPGSKLDIASGSIMLDYGFGLMLGAGGNAIFGDSADIKYVSYGHSRFYIDNNNNDSSSFEVYGNVSRNTVTGALFTIEDTGNVGIGTDTPLGNLTVKSSAIGSTPLRIENSNGALIFSVYNGTGAGAGGAMIQLRDASSIETVRITSDGGHSWFSSGNVGIGTITPISKLQINGNLEIGDGSTINPRLSMWGGWTTGFQSYEGLNAMYNGSGWTGNSGYSAWVKDTYSTTTGNPASDYIHWNYKVSGNLGNSGTTLLSLSGDGNVGIGETTPLSTLHINGGVGDLTTGLTFGDGNTGIYEASDNILKIALSNSDRWQISTGFIQFNTDYGPGIKGATPTSTIPVLLPYVHDGDTGIGHAGANILSLIAGGVNGLNVDGAGQVGIGTGSPGAKLHVSANIGTIPTLSTDNIALFQNNIDGFDGVGITLLSKNNGVGRIDFGNETDADRGSIQYNHTTPKMVFVDNGTEVMTLRDGDIEIGFNKGLKWGSTTTTELRANQGYYYFNYQGLAELTLNTNATSATFLTNEKTVADFRIQTTGTGKHISLNPTGNVGIGIDDPGEKLEISGSGEIYSKITTTSNGSKAGIKFAGNAKSGSILLSDSDGSLRFSASGVADAVYIAQATGYVGIGNTPSYSLDVTGMMRATEGVVTYTKAGTISDTDFTETPIDGLMGVDSTNGRLYFRHGGAWHYVAQTAGFQIPEYETYTYDFNTSSFDTSSPLADGDFLIPFVEGRMSDGAIHGLYTSFSDVKDQLFADELSRILSLEQRVTALEAGGGLTTNPLLSSTGSIGTVAGWSDTQWTFLGSVLFPTDTAGNATVATGADEIVVTFTKPYTSAPVVTANITTDSASAQTIADLGISFVIANTTTNGFSIVLSEPAPMNIDFSWVAILAQ